jgi:hypothetical protein
MVDLIFSTLSTWGLFMMERLLGLCWVGLVRIGPWGLDIGVLGRALSCWLVVIIVLIGFYDFFDLVDGFVGF